jgi:rod shape-determining protein MreB
MLHKRLGIDLGTSRSRVYLEGRGIVLDEPTMVAADDATGNIIAIGEKAQALLGRTPSGISSLKPLENGAICDYHATEAILAYFLRRVLGTFLFIRPEVMISTPLGTTQVERRALVDAAFTAGAKTAYLIEQPLAAAIGAKIPVASAIGSMVINLGAGCSEGIVISAGGIVSSGSIKTGGGKLDKLITSYLMKKHNLKVGEVTAEKIKNKLVAAIPDTLGNTPPMEVDGQDVVSSLPRTVLVTTDEISPVATKILQEIILCIKKVFESTPPELSADILNHGIVATGGLSSMRNLNKLIMQATGVACHVAPNPDTCCALGCGIVMENVEEFERLVVRK